MVVEEMPRLLVDQNLRDRADFVQRTGQDTLLLLGWVRQLRGFGRRTPSRPMRAKEPCTCDDVDAGHWR